MMFARKLTQAQNSVGQPVVGATKGLGQAGTSPTALKSLTHRIIEP